MNCELYNPDVDNAWKDYLACEFSKIDLNLTEEQLIQFVVFYKLLVEKNKVMNLTAITEFEEVVQKHFLDSLMISKYLLLQDETYTVIDLGTGAGFPGIPLKIAFPDLKITLVDSLNKRVIFLQEVIDTLCLDGIEAIHARAEDLARKEMYRESFDFCFSRAVANLSTLSEYCIPFVKKKGSFISYKAGNSVEEIQEAKKAIHVLGGELVKTEEVFLPDSDISRCFVFIKKNQATASKFPRSAGKPSKEPIK